MSDAAFRVFGLDRQVYGPVPITTLQDWAKDGRVQPGTWIHSESKDAWSRADDLPELDAHFPLPANPAPATPKDSAPASAKAGVPLKVLTRLKVFADFPHEELEPFAAEMAELAFRPFTYIVQQGTPGDAMYFVIQGRVGVSTKGQVTESFLVALNIGDTFGEMSLFDPAPRSADVRAENDVIVLKLSVDALQKICREAPAAANRFLWSMARMLSARIRTMDRRAAASKDMDAAGKTVR
jgi:hypothetical protein